MRKIIAFLLTMLAPSLALADATLLPNGKQQYFLNSGAVDAGGSICFYIPNTTTAKQTWQDAAQTTPNTSPCITLDSAGRAIIYGSGTYRQQLFDSLGNLIWDQISNQNQAAVDVQNGGPFWGGTDIGAVNAYALTISDPVVAAYHAGQRFQFIPANTNTGASTLNINSVGAPNILKLGTSGPIALSGGEIVAGNITDVQYDGTEFQLLTTIPISSSTGSIPPSGTIALWSTTSLPTGWLECSGAAVSRTTYASLFAIIGTTYGSGDGSTTFNLPDMRGQFARGWDHGKGTDPGRAFASAQTDQFQGHTFTLTGMDDAFNEVAANIPSGPLSLQSVTTGGAFRTIGISTAPVSDGTDGTPRVGLETRPVNIALIYMIKQ